MTDSTVHPFQRTLGPGPYKFVGVFELGKAVAALNAGNVSGHNNMMANAPRLKSGMGTCSYCGMAISFVCIVQTGNGELYGVGSDCLLKAEMPVKELSRLEKIQRERSKLQRLERKAKKGDNARASLDSLISEQGDVMRKLDHPSPAMASQGKTLLDYAKWIVLNSNDGGVVIALKRIEAFLK